MLTTGTFIVKMHKARCATSFKSATMQQFSNKCKISTIKEMPYYGIFNFRKYIYFILSWSDSCSKKQ